MVDLESIFESVVDDAQIQLLCSVKLDINSLKSISYSELQTLSSELQSAITTIDANSIRFIDKVFYDC